MIQGCQTGRVSRSDLGYVLQYAEPDLDGWEPLLERVLGDLGIRTDDWMDEDEPSCIELDPEQEQPEEAIVEEALRFIEQAQDVRMDPANCYQRDVNTFGLLTAEGEIQVARCIEEGMNQALAALAGCPWVVGELLRRYDSISDGSISLSNAISGFADVENAEPPLLDMDALLAADDLDVLARVDVGMADEANLDEDDEPEVGEYGPDPEETTRRIADLRILYQQTRASVEEWGIRHPRTQALRRELGECFAGFRLARATLEQLTAGLTARVRRQGTLKPAPSARRRTLLPLGRHCGLLNGRPVCQSANLSNSTIG